MLVLHTNLSHIQDSMSINSTNACRLDRICVSTIEGNNNEMKFKYIQEVWQGYYLLYISKYVECMSSI